MKITSKLIKNYLHNMQNLLDDINILKDEIKVLRKEYTDNEMLHPLQASTITDMPSSNSNNNFSQVENFIEKRQLYLKDLIIDELQLRALYISINVTVNRLNSSEKNIWSKKYKDKKKLEEIAKSLNYSIRYVQSLDKKMIDRILNMYMSKIKFLND